MTAAHGADGERWLEGLPRVVERLAERWQLTDIRTAYPGGAVAYVAPVVRAGGAPAVLKVSFLDDETRYEADVLRAWGGHGSVRLLDVEPDDGALLLERLTPARRSPTTLTEKRRSKSPAACSVSSGPRRLPPTGSPVSPTSPPAGRSSFPRWAELGGPFDEALVTHAVAQCRGLATFDRPQVITNRDFHLGNVLSAERAPWLVIDPKPLAGDPAFDTGHLVLTLLPDNPSGGNAAAMTRWIGAALGQSYDRVRMWAYVRAVENALWAAATGGDDPGPYLATAHVLA